jgi:hypothetical protein
MKTWTAWEVVRHHVSICGRVLDANRKPMPGIQVSAVPSTKPLGSQPEPRVPAVGHSSGKSRNETVTSVRNETIKALKQTQSRLDGTFFLLDCPDGEYVVAAADAQSDARAQKTIPVVASTMKKGMKDRKPDEGYQIELILKK